MECTFYDPFPGAGPNDITRIDEGFIDPDKILNIPGRCGEHLLFQSNPYGRMSEGSFLALAESLNTGWRKDAPVTIFVEKGGLPVIHEGNHRLRAAKYINIETLVEIRYFGDSQSVFQITG